ncbi:MAG: FAD binding domain-containing protein [Planctomycetota bacterium]
MTMLLPSYTLHQPQSVKELEALIKELPEFDVLAGGSDILPNYKCGINVKPHMVSLNGIKGLSDIAPTKIGALATLTAIAEDAPLSKALPAVGDAASQVASILIRNQATLGGNLHLDTRCHFVNQTYFWRRSLGYCLKADGARCHVVPKIKVDGKTIDNDRECFATHSSDVAPVMMVLNASVEYVGKKGKRSVALRDLYKHDGIRRWIKTPDEVCLSVTIPKEAQGLRQGYMKLSPRESWDFPVAGVAAALKLGKKNAIECLSICVGSVETTPLMMDTVTGPFIGKSLTESTIAELAKVVMESTQPKLNVPMPPAYRKKMVGVLTKRLLTRLAE